MKITTSKGKTLDANWAFGPTSESGSLMIEIPDNRRLSEIAADFEGNSRIEKTDETKPGVTEIYEGFTELAVIQRNKNGSVLVKLAKE
jgi:hypothetical protein|nr:MAG TPA: hypothetical protein [Caudoviricetes sp.]